MFQEGFDRVAQQMQSRFRMYAEVKPGLVGKSTTFKKIQKREMRDVTGRLQPNVGEEQLFEHRYLFPKKADLTTILDVDDASELGLQVAPTGEISMEHNSAAMRKLDDYFISGILGTNYEGSEDNIQTVTLPESQIVAVNYRTDGGSANTGLTLSKLIQGKGLFGINEVYGQDVEEGGGQICMAVSQQELNNLLENVAQIGSNQYNDVKALVSGTVSEFMGIRFLRTQRLPRTTPSGGLIVRSCPMWISTGVRIGFWNDVTTRIDELTNPAGAIQIYSSLRANAHRKDEDRVVNVLCEQLA